MDNIEQDLKKKVLIYKVKSEGNIHNVAEAIYKAYLEDPILEIQGIGAGAVNQAVKALIIARSKLSLLGVDIAVVPSFKNITNIKDDGKGLTISAINFRILKINI